MYIIENSLREETRLRKKVLTKDCPSCEDMTINEDNKFQCHWGESKDPKLLMESKSKHGLKKCKLIQKGKK